jgi:hypothetical protein
MALHLSKWLRQNGTAISSFSLPIGNRSSDQIWNIIGLDADHDINLKMHSFAATQASSSTSISGVRPSVLD